ncbi:peptide-methionine (S)-S-oxide reductase MsrA [Domibacillus tundrae]|uniref:peptide-methionine (S)-S-oxide reductase MsrA n=1 Tax=Domibacillus tundrae TaxID=1587527 RepID=UPI000617F26D|nr:peptide-methionine (S)-S-oxide reductase [Domibacillus tundrae]
MKTIADFEAEWQARIPNIQTATLGMGCFWSPDARFGAMPGVIRTRVGFAGGTTHEPVYRQMGDHTETVQIDFDPSLLSFEDIIRTFWAHHTSTHRVTYRERQYMSILFYHDQQQKQTIDKVKKELELERKETIETEIQPFTAFILAEDRHQKYHLKRFKQAAGMLETSFPSEASFMNSTLIARLNGFVKEFGTLQNIHQEIKLWNIPDSSRHILLDMMQKIRW